MNVLLHTSEINRNTTTLPYNSKITSLCSFNYVLEAVLSDSRSLTELFAPIAIVEP